MSLSFILWFSISAFLLIFWGWTHYVLLRQKRAWKFYAQKRKLRYYAKRLYGAPSMNGAVDGYKISIFTSEHAEIDSRSQRRLTAIEVNLKTSLSASAALGSGGMVPVVETLDIHQEYKPARKGWDDSYIIRTADIGYMQNYLTDARLNKIIDLMTIDKAWVIFVFFGEKALLRLDTPLAVDDPKEMDKLIKQMINVARAFELEDGEERTLLRKRSQSSGQRKILDIDDDLLEDHLGFELEDDAVG